ncbi:hypothetical protein MRX96_021765 [Rhipicephalus microplus]
MLFKVHDGNPSFAAARFPLRDTTSAHLFSTWPDLGLSGSTRGVVPCRKTEKRLSDDECDIRDAGMTRDECI